MQSISPVFSSATDKDKKYSPPWADLSIIGIAGSSGSGKTSVAMEIVKSLNLPWVVILVMVHLIYQYSNSSPIGLSGFPCVQYDWFLTVLWYRTPSIKA